MRLLTFEYAETSTLHICIPRSFKTREETSALPICIPCSLSYKAKTSALDIEFYTKKYSSHTFTSLLLLLGTVILYCGTIQPCLVRGRLSFDENLRAKEGGKEKAGETRFVSHFSASRVRRVPLPFSSSVSRVSVAFRARLCAKTRHLRKRQLTAYVRKLSYFYLQISSAHIHELRTGFSEEFALKNINKLYSFVRIQFPDVTFIHDIFVRPQL